MAATKPIRIYELVYHEAYTPAGCLTRAQWLRAAHRVVGDFETKLLILHERPHNRKRPGEDPFPPEEVAALRQRLADAEYPDDADRRLLTRMDLACQVTWCNLYPKDAVEPITTPTQTEAWDMLSNLWRCGSHREQFIVGGQDEDTGEKWCFTAGGKITFDWDIIEHKKGDEYLGVKRGEFTRLIDIDLDRHSSAVSSADHLQMVLDTLRRLEEYLPELAWHVSNINPRNGSCHVTGYLPRAIPVAQARAVVADIRSGCPWLQGVEIYPDNCPQFIMPLRRDKVTIIDSVMTPSVKAWKKVELPGQKRKKGRKPQKVRREYLAMDATAYWAWINDENRRPCDPAFVEAELRKAYQGLEDGKGTSKGGKDREARKATPTRPKSGRESSVGTEGGVKLKGRCAHALVNFLEGGDGDARVMSAVMLRAFRNVEEMARGEAVARTHELLGMRPEFEGKPVAGRPKLARMIEATADAVWRDNGYQHDPLGSLAIWSKVKVAWDRRGFRLSDPSTWDRASKSVADDGRDLVWTNELLGLLPALAGAARCDMERARKLLRLVCVHIDRIGEMSLSFMERILADAGVAAYRNNAVRVRRFLEAAGVIVLRKKGFRWGDNDGVGNHYTLGLLVEVAFPGDVCLVVTNPADPAEAAGGGTSIYPSSGRLNVSSLAERMRLKRCLDHYRERVRELCGGYGQAA